MRRQTISGRLLPWKFLLKTISFMATHRRVLGWLSGSAATCDDSCEPPIVNIFSPPPPPPSGDHHGKLPNIVFVVAAVLSAFLLLSLTYLAVLRRFRRRRGWLLRPIYGAEVGGSASGSPSSVEDSVSVDEGVEQPLHHVWYIRTVGLDEAIINSIAVTEYRSSGGDGRGCGGLSAGDCSVCLGEFTDGELVRLLPKCGHAFHVPCIDTWLRAHVNCPLCRALIFDPNPQPAAAAAVVEPLTEAAVVGSMDIDNGSSRDPQEPYPTSEPSEEEQNRGRFDSVVVIDVPVNPEGDLDCSPENSEARGQTDHVDLSATEAIVHRPEGSLGSEEEAKDATFDEGNTPKSKGRQGNCSKGVLDPKAHLGIERSLSSSSRGFIFSKHGRFRRNSSLPL